MLHLIFPDGNAMEACDILDEHHIQNGYINDYRILVDDGEDFEEVLEFYGFEYDIV